MAEDPIRARLDEMDALLEVPTHDWTHEDAAMLEAQHDGLVAALRAVLDLCDDGPGTVRYEMVQVSKLLAVVADALGDTP